MHRRATWESRLSNLICLCHSHLSPFFFFFSFYKLFFSDSLCTGSNVDVPGCSGLRTNRNLLDLILNFWKRLPVISGLHFHSVIYGLALEMQILLQTSEPDVGCATIPKVIYGQSQGWHSPLQKINLGARNCSIMEQVISYSRAVIDLLQEAYFSISNL